MNSNQCLRFTMRIELLEDLHSGTGTGGPGVDAIQALDRRGLPVIRATHVKGVLKAAAEELRSLGLASPEGIVGLFGDASRQGALSMTSLRLPDEASAGPLTLVWASTARTKFKRIPEGDMLRTAEFIAAGTKFRGEVLLRDASFKDLLCLCVRRTDRLGSDRSRGAGLVRIELEESKSEGENRGVGQPFAGARLRLLLTNLDPLCIPITGNPGNIIPTECYIRGQTLFGALAAWEIGAGSQPARMFDRRVSVGDAVPLPFDASEIQRPASLENWAALPIPLSIMTPKPRQERDEKGSPQWPWWAKPGEKILGKRDEIDRLHDKEELPEKPKRPGDTEFLFQASRSHPWVRYSPVIGTHLRNRVPEAGKDMDEGNLFAEQEIAENTLFVADIFFDDDSRAEWFRDAFEPVLAGREWLSIGRGSRAVAVVDCKWLPAGSPPEGSPEDGLILTLTSDLIVRSKDLTFANTLDGQALGDLTGIRELTVKVPQFADIVEVRGFNAASRLPRAPVLAIRRGSVFRIKAGESCTELRKKLSGIYALGERTWEGFGRFVLGFDPVGQSRACSSEPSAAVTPEDGPGKLDETGVRERILEESLGLAKSIARKPVSDIPSVSQWQSLRQVALVAEARGGEEGFQIIEGQLKAIAEHSRTKGGARWKNAELTEINKAIDRYRQATWIEDKATRENRETRARLQDASRFLDSLVRWILIELERKLGKEGRR